MRFNVVQRLISAKCWNNVYLSVFAHSVQRGKTLFFANC